MEYVDGGWSMNQVVKNITGLIAVFSIGYAGSALQKFAAANRGLSFSQFSYSVAGTVSSVISSGFTVLMWALDPGSAICEMMCQRAGYPKDNYWVPIN